jgi:methylglutaconyl-CoA hydratase
MPLVNIVVRGPVAFIELARPESGNALCGELVTHLIAGLAAACAGDARAVVLTGAGKHFCTGADLTELAATADAPEGDRVADAARLADLYSTLLRHPLVTIAAVHGAVFGGGAGLAAACDFVVAGESARFQFSEARLGFVPALISVFLSRRIPPARLATLFLDPEPLGPEAARGVGLVDEIAPDPRCAAESLATRVCRKIASSAAAETKRLLLDLALPDLDHRFAAAARINARQRAHPECRRGLSAILTAKTFPDWMDRS